MTVYRLVFRHNGGEWRHFKTYGSGDRPYTSLTPVKALKTVQEKGGGRFEFKIQSADLDWQDLPS